MLNINLLVEQSLNEDWKDKIKSHFNKHGKKYATGAGIIGLGLATGGAAKKYSDHVKSKHRLGNSINRTTDKISKWNKDRQKAKLKKQKLAERAKRKANAPIARDFHIHIRKEPNYKISATYNPTHRPKTPKKGVLNFLKGK